MKIKYLGPHDEVELPDGQTVKRGQAVEVADDLAGHRPEARLAAAMTELAAATEARDHQVAVDLRKEIVGLDYGSGLLAQDTWEAVGAKQKDEVKA